MTISSSGARVCAKTERSVRSTNRAWLYDGMTTETGDE
jgi:hypothetical protein